MLVTTLAIQPKQLKDEQVITKFYKELDISRDSDGYTEKLDRRSFGIYDYSKKNKFVNNTELDQDDGRTQCNSERN